MISLTTTLGKLFTALRENVRDKRSAILRKLKEQKSTWAKEKKARDEFYEKLQASRDDRNNCD